MNQKKCSWYSLSLIVLVLLTNLPVRASFMQQEIIKGKVTDDKGGPMPGVGVVVKGTQKRTQTDGNGNFSLQIADRNPIILVFSYVGFQTQEVSVTTPRELKIQMKASTSVLDEIVVVGYGTVTRRDLTGAVASISANDLKDIPISSAADALAGRLAGVQVTSSEGAPGSETNIVIRGGGSITQDNAPLYVIDGMQVESGLTGISPQDIASVDVLKDAAATAIYGARGANGVIVVTTKGGKEGKTVVSVNSFMGINKLSNKLGVMSPYDFVEYQYERSRGNVNAETSFARKYGSYFDTLAVYKNTPAIDWEQEMFGRNALIQTHNFGISGGSKSTTFNISLTKNIQDGIMLNSDFDRNIANLKFDHVASNKFKTGATVRFISQEVMGAGTSAAGQTQTSRLRQTIKYKPFITNVNLGIEDFDQAYYNETNAVGNGVFIINPIALNKAEYRSNGSKGINLAGYVNYNFTRYLSFRTTAGYDYSSAQVDSFDDINTPGSIFYGLGLPVAGVINTQKSVLNVSNVLNFSNSTFNTLFSRNNVFTFLLGQEIYETDIRQNNSQLNGFPAGITADKALGQLNLGTMRTSFPTSLILESKILSFFSRATYSHKGKYLAAFSLRTDGSTKFAPDKRWGYFPAASLAWRISQEKFMKPISFISDMKLRLSWGQAGNNRIDDYLYLSAFQTNLFPYGLNEVMQPSYTVTKLANPNLKWEKTISRNIGLDLGILKNKLLFTFNAYQNDVKDLLIPVPIPSTSGYAAQLQNVGSTRNKGFEFQLDAAILSKKDFTWKTNFNISYNENKILSLSTYQKEYLQGSGWGISGQPDYAVSVGQAVGAMYGFVTDGYYKTEDFNYDPATKIYSLKSGIPDGLDAAGVSQPGSIKFKDINGDGVVNQNDRKIIGNANPKFSGGMNQQFRYKQFDLSIFANFVIGNDIMNANKIEFTNGFVTDNNMLSIMGNRWKTIDNLGNLVQTTATVGGKQVAIGEAPEILNDINKGANIWQPLKGTGAYTLHSRAVEDGSFLRINNITLGYTFSPGLLAKIKVKSLRLYGTVNNIAVITNYSGYDPEVNAIRNSPVTRGVDYSAYPRSKAYIFGLNLTL
ncbi:SusC/RagA family TonB-linked outer membrane protein [Pedobacter hiemivivus]|uniref:TonB-dependent receptor n=1 Tax=Pedobacter hiemivivus TaxID=2530454 RepID=A0A4R0MQE0_9SPHI|nr:TonB-dependent receptor [Pedobacter hiemivivus]TCC88482.1 TonB-dependent receptor [Pedobacter hiemivivus]